MLARHKITYGKQAGTSSRGAALMWPLSQPWHFFGISLSVLQHLPTHTSSSSSHVRKTLICSWTGLRQGLKVPIFQTVKIKDVAAGLKRLQSGAVHGRIAVDVAGGWNWIIVGTYSYTSLQKQRPFHLLAWQYKKGKREKDCGEKSICDKDISGVPWKG